MQDKQRPIIVKRVKKVKAGHHGGSWKVAFADFMTAMFAMFLVLWLVTAMDESQRRGIADYFRNPTLVEAGQGGGPPSLVDFDGGSEVVIDLGNIPLEARGEGTVLQRTSGWAMQRSESPGWSGTWSEEQEQRLEALQMELEEAIGKSQALEPFKDQLFLDITPEGLRIQIVDRRNRPMFDLGSPELKDYAELILREFAQVANSVPNRIAITGHTDAIGFAGNGDYDNWELSADRANAARRALLRGGIETDRVVQVMGLADRVLFDAENPDSPINRRISITVLNEDAEEAIHRREGGVIRDRSGDVEALSESRGNRGVQLPPSFDPMPVNNRG